ATSGCAGAASGGSGEAARAGARRSSSSSGLGARPLRDGWGGRHTPPPPSALRPSMKRLPVSRSSSPSDPLTSCQLPWGVWTPWQRVPLTPSPAAQTAFACGAVYATTSRGRSAASFHLDLLGPRPGTTPREQGVFLRRVDR